MIHCHSHLGIKEWDEHYKFSINLWKWKDFSVFSSSWETRESIELYHLTPLEFPPLSHVSEWLGPQTKQHTPSPLTPWLGWHESGSQRTRQTLTWQECPWGRRRSRRGCCVKPHAASWRGAPSSQQCSPRLAAGWTGFIRRELRLVRINTLSSKAPIY